MSARERLRAIVSGGGGDAADDEDEDDQQQTTDDDEQDAREVIRRRRRVERQQRQRQGNPGEQMDATTARLNRSEELARRRIGGATGGQQTSVDESSVEGRPSIDEGARQRRGPGSELRVEQRDTGVQFRVALPDEAEPGQVTGRERTFGSAELGTNSEGELQQARRPSTSISTGIAQSLERSARQEPADIDGVTPESVNDALASGNEWYGDEVGDRAAAVGGFVGENAARQPMTLNQVSPETGERLGAVAGRSAVEIVNPAAFGQAVTTGVDAGAYLAGGAAQGPGEAADRAGELAQEAERTAGAVGVAAIENPVETGVQIGTGAVIGSGAARGVQRIARRAPTPSAPTPDANPGRFQAGDRGIGGGGGIRRGARERRDYEFPEQEEVEVEKEIEAEDTADVEESVSDAASMHELRSRTQSSAGRARPIDADRRANPNADTAEGRVPPREAFDSDERYQEALERREQEIQQEQQATTDVEAEGAEAAGSTEAAVVAGAAAPSPDPGRLATSATPTMPRSVGVGESAALPAGGRDGPPSAEATAPRQGPGQSIGAGALLRSRARSQGAQAALSPDVDQQAAVEADSVQGTAIPASQQQQTQQNTTTAPTVDVTAPATTTFDPPAAAGLGIADSPTTTPTPTPTPPAFDTPPATVTATPTPPGPTTTAPPTPPGPPPTVSDPPEPDPGGSGGRGSMDPDTGGFFVDIDNPVGDEPFDDPPGNADTAEFDPDIGFEAFGGSDGDVDVDPDVGVDIDYGGR